MTKRGRREKPLPRPPRRRPEGSFDESVPVVRDAGQWRARLEERLRLLPPASGVYLFRDLRGRVIYVGKAKRLQTRVRSYFRAPAPSDPRLVALRARIRSLDYVAVGSEMEALILEANLIKQHAPRFNIRLKDDTKYPYIKVTVGHPFPALGVTRNVVPDGSRYFGPFTQVRDLRRTLRTLRTIFRLRNCTDQRLEQGGRECLQYFLGFCTAPCTARVDRAAYGAQVAPVLEFLSGRGAEALVQLRSSMEQAAVEYRFEEAARVRDGLFTLSEIVREQRMTPAVAAEGEVLGLTVRGPHAAAVLLLVSDGKVLGKRHHIVKGTRGLEPSEVLRAVLLALYLDAPHVPETIYLPSPTAEKEELEALLTQRSGHPVRLRSARGDGLKGLVRAAQENSHLVLEEEELRERSRRQRVTHAVYALQEALGLPHPPYRIEGFDISNFQGAEPVASQVVFKDGKPLKSAYRRYSMAAIPGPDDFAMMGSVIERRATRLLEREETAPDLILVDGGVGQVGRAAEVLQAMGLAHLPLIGLAKREEEIVRPHGQPTIRLSRGSEALQLLQRVRDEAHRFAVQYHRLRRAKSQKKSELDAIRGIGPNRRRALLRAFGSVQSIRQAEAESIAAVPGIGPELARAIQRALQDG